MQELGYRQRMQRYVEVAIFANLLSKGLNVEATELEAVLGFYEDTMNHRAFLPGVMERFLAERGATPGWSKEAIQRGLAEVSRWSEEG